MTKTIEMPGVTLPEIDDTTRREFLLGIAGLLLLPAACGGDGEGGGSSGRTRTVELASGTVKVPSDPQRVVVLQSFVLPHMLPMGVEPIAVSMIEDTLEPSEIVPTWLDASLPEGIATFSGLS